MSKTQRTPTPAAAEAPQAIAVQPKRVEHVTMEDLTRIASGLSECYLDCLVAAAKALESNQGYTTPAEDFILEVLSTYEARGSRMEPRHVKGDVERFKEHFEDLKFIVRRYGYLADEHQAPAQQPAGMPAQ